MPALSDRDARWRDLRTRALSAVVLAPLVLAVLWFGGLPFALLLSGAAVGMALEWAAMARLARGGAAWTALVLPIVGSAICGAVGAWTTGIAIAVLGAALSAAPWPRPDADVPPWGPSGAPRWALPAGVLYIALGCLSLAWLRAEPAAGRETLVFVLLLVWASDIGAYVAGRIFGGPKLAPSISPGKTVSGAVGGLVVAVGVAILVSWLLTPGAAGLWWAAAIAVPLAVSAQCGDLFESKIKRLYDVKDSGTTIPGHGGLLDRLDALLLAAPVAAVLAIAAGRGVMSGQ